MWKDIDGFEGLYQVSSEGQVRNSQTGLILKPNIIKNGYSIVHLRKNGKRYACYIHRLVAQTFLPNPHNLPVVNHIDGDKQNLHFKNLEWTSYHNNNQHAYDIGLHGKGENQYKAKLHCRDIKEIRANGKYTTFQDIADKYGVSKATIRDVLIGRTWKHVTL